MNGHIRLAESGKKTFASQFLIFLYVRRKRFQAAFKMQTKTSMQGAMCFIILFTFTLVRINFRKRGNLKRKVNNTNICFLLNETFWREKYWPRAVSVLVPK